ncbi:GGDEF domain-containing protein [Herbaspirillum sp. RV1423]|uniref:bifunctional diguanylate cyclase/phosphodiesterase n=1 Tax=Herbaspirillum sp. RV1423 TaxID=1443993 RepID=UPI0006876E98|nr:GGDEF domain-containing protein [Herbaspirillum sp. RV1423]
MTMKPDAAAHAAELEKLTQSLLRERDARLQAEAAAEHRLRRLQALEAVTAAANQADTMDEALQFAVDEICRYTGWPLGHCFHVQKTGKHTVLTSSGIWHGASRPEFAAFHCYSSDPQFQAERDLPGRALKEAAPVWIVNIGADRDAVRADVARAAGIRAAIAFPVVSGGGIVAVLEFFSVRILSLDDHLLRLMDLMREIGTRLGRVAERQQAQQRLIHEASHDALTGLPNRSLFLQQLDLALKRQWDDDNARFAVLFIDIDRFKIVNDSLGHLAGDRMIVQVAARLKNALRPDRVASHEDSVGPSYTLARMGGDEFTILLRDIPDADEAVRIAERIQSAMALPFLIRDQEIYASASTGIVFGDVGHTLADEVLRDADLAMYRAKATGKSHYEVFDRSMRKGAVSRLAIETALRHALKNNEFVLHYQPIIELQAGTIVGVEALVRWRRGPDELVYPGDFIGVAEDTGLILYIGMWVLREACRQMHLWHRQFPRAKPLTISVNISPRQFVQPNLVDQIKQIIADTGIDPNTLRLEITESVTMGDVERTIRILSQLRALGVRFSVDDFGTGYSSLSYLHRFPLDVLKIDRSFVMRMNEDRERLQIVQTIMTLARNLGIEVVAEGTETEMQVEHLRSLGCDFGQGFFFSRALAPETVTDLLYVPHHVLETAYVNSLQSLAQ